jgi:regulatory protein
MAFRRAAKRDYTEDSLYEYAVAALARRMRTVAELKRLLRSRVAHQPNAAEMIEAVVSRLKQQRYLNDTTYAATFSALRRDNDKLARARVAHELRARGIHAEVIEKTLAESYGDIDESTLARQFLERKRVAPPRNDRDAARIFRQLARAGFATRIILPLLRRWKVDDDTLAALEQEREASIEQEREAAQENERNPVASGEDE